MPRHKEYNREEVVNNAMMIFWKKGYEETSIQDLVDATGLNRFGMYQAFGSKEGLFLEALKKYQEDVTRLIMRPLKNPSQGLKAIKIFFDQRVNSNCRIKSIKGCLITNTAVDLPVMCKDAAKNVRKQFKRMEDAFLACLAAARDRGEIEKTSDLKALASYLLGITQAIGVLERSDPDPVRIRNLVGVALGRLTLGA